jgi:hypothetical protein
MTRTAHSPRFRPSLLCLEDRTAPAVLTVTNLSDHDPGSLRAEINLAQNDDTVDFDPSLSGTITLTSGPLSIAKRLTIEGPGADVIAVSGNHTSRVFSLPGANAVVTMSGLTIQDGLAINPAGTTATGGGIDEGFGATLTLADCILTGNEVRSSNSAVGGALSVNGQATLTDCTITYNTASANGSSNVGAAGAGVYVWGAPATLNMTGCFVGGNEAIAQGSSSNNVYGAGIASFGNMTLTDCQVEQNTGDASAGPGPGFAMGGGVFTTQANTITLTDTTVAYNLLLSTNGSRGGGVYDNLDTVMLTRCTIAGNEAAAINTNGTNATSYGGGLYGQPGTTLVLTNCTVAGNVATATGQFPNVFGGGAMTFGEIDLVSSTVSGNSSDGPHGGISISTSGSASLLDTIVAGNFSSDGNVDVGTSGRGTVTSQGYNLIGATGNNIAWQSSDLVGTSDNPLDPLLGPLQDNGGPTQTIALLAGSPALNAGTANGAPATDQRGLTRTGGYNIGSYQASATSFEVDTPATVTAGQYFSVTATALDDDGNVAVGYVGTVALTSTDPQNPDMDMHAFTLDDAGSFTFTGEQLFTAGPQTLFASDGIISGSSAVVNVVPGAAAQLILTVPGDPMHVPAGIVPVTVFAADAYGNLITNYRGTIHFSADDPTLFFPPDYTYTAADAGSHVFEFLLTRPGPVTITASDPGNGLMGHIDLIIV